MNIYRFGPLQSGADVRARFFLRLLWSGIGFVIGLPFLIFRGHNLEATIPFLLVLILIPVTGAFADAYRLKNPEMSAARMRRTAIPFIFGVLVLLIVAVIYMSR